MQDFNVSVSGVALLVFIMAFYGLAARERKTPYITGTAYATVILVLLVIFIDILSKLTKNLFPDFSYFINVIAKFSFLFSLLYVMYRILHIYIRHMNFRDDQLWNIPLVRQFRNWRYNRHDKAFEHSPIGITPDLLNTINKSGCFSEGALVKAVNKNQSTEEMKLSISTVYKTSSWSMADEKTTKLAIDFLEHGAYVQYTPCSRHPIEFILYLKSIWESKKQTLTKQWEEIRKNIVVVDAYTPHYGFTDTTHVEWTKRINKEIKVECITSLASYAGIHTSAANAFNIIKKRHKKSDKDVRYPTLLIYEGLYGLVDLESVEQYRVFIRHLLPSEKLWGGMFTFVIESAIPDNEFKLLKTYADAVIDED